MRQCDSKHTRLAGLDTLRALAIALVLMSRLATAAAVLHGVMNEAPTAFIASTFGFSLVSVSFALLTVSSLSPGALLNRVRIPGAASLALWSYAVYLVHKPVFMALRPELERRRIDPGAPLTIVAVTAAGIFSGSILYRMVEAPFMRLRERLYSTGAVKTTQVGNVRNGSVDSVKRG